MARLTVEPDLLRAGSWTVRSDNSAALAGVSDAIVSGLGLQSDALGAWAIHYDEQDQHAEDAYARERQEVGVHAQVQVMVRPTAARRNVVYIDRMHFVTVSAPPQAGSRLLGMYVGTMGDIALSVHHPSVSQQVGALLQRMAAGDQSLADGRELTQLSRFVVGFERNDAAAVWVGAPPALALHVQQALGQLATLVSAW
ncbi:MAG: hypothetical protein JWN41_1343 [Thermoleophilia bacterium]|nr:hypothetical protein [Thermoleophilia bacterium]